MTKLICAIDTADIYNAIDISKKVLPFVDILKLGLEFFTSCGILGVEKIASLGKPIFLDLKLHDIPNTVAKALAVIKKIKGVYMTTIHASGGKEMLLAAKQELGNSNIKPFGVTLLTSLQKDDLKILDIDCSASDFVQNLATFCYKIGLEGVVCSAHEVPVIKKACGQDFLTISPGIGNNKDQKRSAQINELKTLRPDYIVVGRGIANSKDPSHAARSIYELIK